MRRLTHAIIRGEGAALIQFYAEGHRFGGWVSLVMFQESTTRGIIDALRLAWSSTWDACTDKDMAVMIEQARSRLIALGHLERP